MRKTEKPLVSVFTVESSRRVPISELPPEVRKYIRDVPDIITVIHRGVPAPDNW